MKRDSRARLSHLRRESRSESGQALVLVLVLLLVGSILILALANAATNDVHNTGNFAKARSISYDATSAIDVAIQSIRYTPLLRPTETLNASPPSPCWPTTAERTTVTKQNGVWPTGEPTSALPNTGGNLFRVWCSTRWTPSLARTRTVTLSACKVQSLASPVTKKEASACAVRPLVQETVVFDDYPKGKATPTEAPCKTSCGEYVTVESWVERPAMPKVTYLSCAHGSVTCIISPIGGYSSGGTTINIIGTGFVTGSTVQFVEEAGGTPTLDNVVLTAAKVTFVSPTALVATVPGVTEGTTYFVTVTTPVGTSAYSSSDVFTFKAAAPTVTSVCTDNATPPTGSTCNTHTTSTKASGPVSGGTEVTIWGKNFICLSSCGTTGGGPTVKFGSLKSNYVTIVSTTEIIATTPAEYKTTPPKDVAVTVKTPGGTSGGTVEFDYVSIVPTVEKVTYTSASQKVIIKGTGFVTGSDSVSFEPEKPTGSPTTTASNVKTSSRVTVETVTGVIEITASVPTLTKTQKYFVIVTSTGRSSSPYPTFKYV